MKDFEVGEFEVVEPGILPALERGGKYYVPMTSVTTSAARIEEFLSSSCGCISVEGPQRLDASYLIQSFGSIKVARYGLQGVQLRRKMDLNKLDVASGHDTLLIVEQGRARFTFEGEEHTLNRGDMFFCDTAWNCNLDLRDEYTMISSVRVDRSVMHPRFAEIAKYGIKMTSEYGIGASIKDILRIMQASGEEIGRRYSETFLGLIGSALAECKRCASPQPSYVSLAERAIAVIEDRFRDHNLSSTCVAAELGVSLRTLQREFALMGTSVSAEIVKMRLADAHARLKLGQDQIVNVAFDAGFNDLPNFYRHYKAKYKCSPGATRSASGGGLIPDLS